MFPSFSILEGIDEWKPRTMGGPHIRLGRANCPRGPADIVMSRSTGVAVRPLTLTSKSVALRCWKETVAVLANGFDVPLIHHADHEATVARLGTTIPVAAMGLLISA